MANTGARAYYILLETLKNSLLQNVNVNTVTTGDISEIDLSKQTIYPLSHIIVNNATNSGQVMTFNVTVLCMDKVNQLKTEQVNPFNNEAEHTVLNTQLAVSNKLYKDLYSGQLRLDGYQVDDDASIEFFFDRFENILAGVAMTLNIQLNNDLNVC
tara:strand:- start:11283 stop:11750 length:468 start_codon:yes stop_codon:yes gene_type:complete